MSGPDSKKIAERWMRTAGMKTAGEVRFVKDRSGDAGAWGWGAPGPSERHIQQEFVFQPKHLKPLAKTLRSSLMALGHVTSAYNTFVKIKSRNISPDGSLGGKGYIQKIPEMRRQLMNCVEALSAFTDTVYDELKAPHWNSIEDTMGARDREEVREIVQESEEIKSDPESWAEAEEEHVEETMGEVRGKTAKLASKKLDLNTSSYRFDFDFSAIQDRDLKFQYIMARNHIDGILDEVVTIARTLNAMKQDHIDQLDLGFVSSEEMNEFIEYKLYILKRVEEKLSSLYSKAQDTRIDVYGDTLSRPRLASAKRVASRFAEMNRE